MNIGKLALMSGIAPSAIRYYEKAGLLPAATRRSNGYREYDASTLEQLKLIAIGQGLGFSLDDIRGVLALHGNALQEALMASMETRLVDIDKMMQALDAQRAALLDARQKLHEHGLALLCGKPLAGVANGG